MERECCCWRDSSQPVRTTAAIKSAMVRCLNHLLSGIQGWTCLATEERIELSETGRDNCHTLLGVCLWKNSCIYYVSPHSYFVPVYTHSDGTIFKTCFSSVLLTYYLFDILASTSNFFCMFVCPSSFPTFLVGFSLFKCLELDEYLRTMWPSFSV